MWEQWLAPHLASKSAKRSENALQPPHVNMPSSGSKPHAGLAFRVLAVKAATSVSSARVSERTGASGKDHCFGFLYETSQRKCCLEIKVKKTLEVEGADGLAMNSFVVKKA